MKICLAASAGGHLTELLRMAEAWEARPHFLVTTTHRLRRRMTSKEGMYVVTWANRRNPLLLLLMLAECVVLMLKERPDVVISTGAAVGCIVCLIAKSMGRKVVWIDNLSHVDRLTLSGRIIRPFADLFLVQWPELVDRYAGVRYEGTVI